MRLALMPHTTPYFGQDFTATNLFSLINIKPVYLDGLQYNKNQYKGQQVEMIVSRYPDNASDLLVFEEMYGVVPLVSHVHLNYGFLSPLQKETLKKTISLSALLLTNCKMLNHQYETIFPQYKWSYIDNGIDSRKFYPSTDIERIAFRKKYNIPPKHKLICYTGRLNNAKGLQIIENLINHISINERFILIIQTIALPKYYSQINKICKNRNVILITSQEDKIVRYCDVSIQPSLSETTSMVALESLFSGVPVICTDVTNFYDEIDQQFAKFSYFKRINIKDCVETNNDEKQNLKIIESKIKDICQEFWDELNTMLFLDQVKRVQLSRSLKHSKFNIDKLAKSLETRYSEIVI